MTANLRKFAPRQYRVDLFAFAGLNRLQELSEEDNPVQATVGLEGVGATKTTVVAICVLCSEVTPVRAKRIQGSS